jgi:hypothetical protein
VQQRQFLALPLFSLLALLRARQSDNLLATTSLQASMAILVMASGSQSKNFRNDPPTGWLGAGRMGWMRGIKR